MKILDTELLPLEIENIKTYTGIGFCQPKFYQASAWNRAKKCMTRLIELGYVTEFDYGWGKGKYTTTEKGEEIGIQDLYEKLVEDNFVLIVRNR